MKVTKSLLIACACLGLFACSNEDTPSPEGNLTDGETQSIAIRLEGLSSNAEGRAFEEPITESSASSGKHTATLSDIALIGTDETNILTVKTINSTDNSGNDWSQLTTAESGYIMHNVPSQVRKVYAIGNYSKSSAVKTFVDDLSSGAENQDNETSNVTLVSGKTIADMEKVVVSGTDNKTFADVLLFGVDEQLATTSSVTDDSHPDNIIMQADITIKPLVSRIEITKISCENLGSIYSELTLKTIGLMNVYNTLTLGGTAGDAITLATCDMPEANPGSDDKIQWGSASETTYAWAWDNFSANTTLNSTTKQWTGDSGKIPAYQFFAKQVDNTNFHVKLFLEAKETSGEATSALNTVTANISSDNDFTMNEPGKIYKVELNFAEENIGTWDPDEKICINVRVTAEDWTIVTLDGITYE